MARLAWTVQVEEIDQAVWSFSLQSASGPTQTSQLERPILEAAAPAPAAGDIGLLREYLDPLNNQPLGLAHLRAGQLVRVRLTIVNTEPRRSLAIDEPLPGGFMLVEVGDASFAQIEQDRGSLSLTSAEFAPGIYQYHYLLRAVAAGRYDVPASTARQLDSDLISAGKPATLLVVK